jgi:hypothetical protein
MSTPVKKFTKPDSKSFGKHDVSIVSSDWTGTEGYWTQVAGKVYTTEVGTDPGNVQIRYVSSYVDNQYFEVEIEFPDSDEWTAGEIEVSSEYPNITKREIHILEKPGSIPTRFRIDAYNGTTLLAQYLVFRDFSDAKIFKYGLRIRHLVAPNSFSFDYEVSDDSPFKDFGIVIPEGESDSTSDPADVVGKTFFFSIPTAYLPEGRALIGGAFDSSARVMSFASFLIAALAIIYVIYYTPVPPKPSQKSQVPT